MVFYETFKHKYDVKIKENNMLLQRVEELSTLNGETLDKLLKKQ